MWKVKSVVYISMYISIFTMMKLLKKVQLCQSYSSTNFVNFVFVVCVFGLLSEIMWKNMTSKTKFKSMSHHFVFLWPGNRQWAVFQFWCPHFAMKVERSWGTLTDYKPRAGWDDVWIFATTGFVWILLKPRSWNLRNTAVFIFFPWAAMLPFLWFPLGLVIRGRIKMKRTQIHKPCARGAQSGGPSSGPWDGA